MKKLRPTILATAMLMALPLLARSAPSTPPATTFEQEHAAWRAWRLSRLTADDGWTTLIGLHWLREGDNTLGSAAGARVPLPAGKAPASVGVLRLEAGKVTLLPEPGSGLTADGRPVAGPLALGTDQDETTTLLELGPLNFYVLQRGDRLGVRLRDREATLRREFPGLDYFPVDERYRVVARFTPNPPGTTVQVANVLGMTDAVPSPGRLDFELHGTPLSLVALDDTGDGRLFLIVGDQTNGYETYGAGRYLYAAAPENGQTVVDLNRLYNPPCAFTAYSTCQLPPKENKLPLRLEAGEKKFVLPARP